MFEEYFDRTPEGWDYQVTFHGHTVYRKVWPQHDKDNADILDSARELFAVELQNLFMGPVRLA